MAVGVQRHACLAVAEAPRIVRTSTPARISTEAWVCLKAWNGTGGSFLASDHRHQALAQIARREQLTLDGAEDEGVGLDGAGANGKAQLHLLHLVARSMAIASAAA